MEWERDKTIGPDDAAFKRIPGIRRETFEKVPGIPEAAYTELHSRGGKPPKLSVYDKLLISLQYLREYRTMEHIGVDYGVCKSEISDTIRRMEDTPVKDGTFRLPGKKALRMKTARQFGKDDCVVVCLSGRGDKDAAMIARYRGKSLRE